MLPIVILSGKAGSGKDTVADFFVKNHNVVKIAMSDPMKRFCQSVFEFTDDQLWGPSDYRNGVDSRYLDEEKWNHARVRMVSVSSNWLKSINVPDPGDKLSSAHKNLDDWFTYLYKNNTKFSPRIALQYLGTQTFRSIDPNIWVNNAIGIAKTLLGGGYRYSREQGLIVDKAPHLGAPLLIPSFITITDGRFANEILNVKSIGGIAIKIKSDYTANVGIDNHASETSIDKIPQGWFDITLINNKEFGMNQLEFKINSLVERLFKSVVW